MHRTDREPRAVGARVLQSCRTHCHRRIESESEQSADRGGKPTVSARVSDSATPRHICKTPHSAIVGRTRVLRSPCSPPWGAPKNECATKRTQNSGD